MKCIACGQDAFFASRCDCGFVNPDRYDFVVFGEPVSQKNDRDVIEVKGRLIPIASDMVKAWHESAAVQLRNQLLELRSMNKRAFNRLPIGKKNQFLRINIAHYIGPGRALDLDNLDSAPFDALEKAKIVSNDYWFDEKHSYRYRDNNRPRVEIIIEVKT